MFGPFFLNLMPIKSEKDRRNKHTCILYLDSNNSLMRLPAEWDFYKKSMKMNHLFLKVMYSKCMHGHA